MRRCFTFLAILLTLPAAASARPVIHRAPVFPVTNGRDTAAWIDRAGLRVAVDGRPPLTYGVPAAGCDVGGVNTTDVGLFCGRAGAVGEGVDLVSIANGAVREPRVDPAIEAFTSPGSGITSGFTMFGLGDRVVGIDYYEDHTGSHPRWFVLDSDAQTLDLYDPPAGSIVDLDAPTGLRRVCAPAPTRAAAGRLLYRAPWILTKNGARVLLRHCGSRRTRLVGRTTNDTWPVLTGRYAAWATGRDDEIVIRMLADGRTYHLHTATFTLMAATDHRLWLHDYDPSTYTARVVEIP